MSYKTNLNPEKKLTSFINIKAPEEKGNTIPVYEFERFRALDLDWEKITGQNYNGSNPEIRVDDLLEDIKEFFYDNWKSKDFPSQEVNPEENEGTNSNIVIGTDALFWDYHKVCWSVKPLLIHSDTVNKEHDEGQELNIKEYFSLLYYPENSFSNTVSRHYILLNSEGKGLTKEEFDTLGLNQNNITFEKAWEIIAKAGYYTVGIGYELDVDYGTVRVITRSTSPDGQASSLTVIPYPDDQTNLDQLKKDRHNYLWNVTKHTVSKEEKVDREIIFYRQEFFRLKALKDFADDFKNKSKDYVKQEYLGSKEGEGDNFNALWEDEEFLDITANKATNAAIKVREINEKIRLLVEKVKDLGYVLMTENGQDRRPPLPTQKYEAGDIFQLIPRVHEWTSVHISRVRYKRRKCGRTKYYWRTYRTQKRNRINYFEYIKIDLAKSDPVEEKVLYYHDLGKKVFVCERTSNGFYTESGIPVREILAQCQDNEKFRRECVIVIPEYDHILSNKKYFTGAFFYENPLPGMLPIKYPEIGFREDLSYKLVWKGVELGQLVNSINLAPGESRTITTSSKFVTTTTDTSSFKSISEISKSDSYDLATEFQKEAKREFQRTRSSSASASAGGSFGGFSGSASGSTSSSSKLSTFARQMSKIAKQTVSKVNRTSKQEVNSTSSKSTEVSESSNRVITVNNTNQGSTLNLLFHQLNNVFEGSVYVNSIDVMVDASKELIAGSGIFEQRWAKLGDLKEILFLLDENNIPGHVSNTAAYYDILLKSLFTGLTKEYCKECPGLSAEVITLPKASTIRLVSNDVRSQSVLQDRLANVNETLSTPELVQHILFKTSQSIANNDDENRTQNLFLKDEDERINFAEIIFNDIVIDYEKPIKTSTLILNSGAMYLESVVGMLPAVDNYTEHMRQLESQRVETEINKERSLIDEIKLRNRVLQQSNNNYITNVFTYPLNENSHHVQLTTFKNIDDNDTSNWKIILASSEVKNASFSISDNVMTLVLPGKTGDVAAYEKDLVFVNKVSGHILKRY